MLGVLNFCCINSKMYNGTYMKNIYLLVSIGTYHVLSSGQQYKKIMMFIFVAAKHKLFIYLSQINCIPLIRRHPRSCSTIRHPLHFP